MKAIARHTKGMFTHVVDTGGHQLIVDEPVDRGGADEGPSPQDLLAASIASCTAITLGMYANRKGWDLGQVEVECEYAIAERGSPTRFNVVLRLPDGCSEEQVNALRVIAAKCPVHRLLAGDSTFEERIELVAPLPT
jgi:putative redox protein